MSDRCSITETCQLKFTLLNGYLEKAEMTHTKKDINIFLDCKIFFRKIFGIVN